MQRVQRLLDKRIIREITPIFDTRALGYSSMLVAAKVDAEYPHRAAKIINSHPGVTHNYLRNHDFNLWFTIAAEPGSKLGLHGHARRARSELTGAESIRQLPTLKLFKIRMDLEMEKGTDALPTAGEAVEPLELDPIELSDEDIDDDPRHPGPDAGRRRAVRARRRAARRLARTRCSRAWSRCASAAACAASPRSSTTAAPASRANGMGVWKVPEGQDARASARRMAAFRGISHCYQRPTYADWPYSVFTMAHGRSKEECDAILDSIAEATGIDRARDAVLEHRVQEGPDALLHRRLPPLGGGARLSAPR